MNRKAACSQGRRQRAKQGRSENSTRRLPRHDVGRSLQACCCCWCHFCFAPSASDLHTNTYNRKLGFASSSQQWRIKCYQIFQRGAGKGKHRAQAVGRCGSDCQLAVIQPAELHRGLLRLGLAHCMEGAAAARRSGRPGQVGGSCRRHGASSCCHGGTQQQLTTAQPLTHQPCVPQACGCVAAAPSHTPAPRLPWG